MCILLFLDGMSYRYLLSQAGLMCHLRQPLFPYWFSLWMICLLMNWGIKLLYYYCIIVNLSLYVCLYLLYIFRCSYIRFLNVYKCFSLFLCWSFYLYIIFFFSFIVDLFSSLLYLLWVLWTKISFYFHLHATSFSTLTFSLCVFSSEESVL